MHALGDFMAPTLKDHSSARVEVNAHVRAVDFLFHDERWVSDERLGFRSAKVLVIFGALRAKEMRGARVFNEIVAGSAHTLISFGKPQQLSVVRLTRR